MKKTIFTLNIDGYPKGITDLTYPLMERYARKIGADFYIIKDRKFPDWPPVYEKLQIYELSKQMGNDWNIYIDSDAIVHPDMFDITEFLKKDTICHHGADMANNRWKYDDYFRRDGRHIGSCNWFCAASDWCTDLWTPLDISFEQAMENIFPVQSELNTIVTREHLIDDYALSRNIAKFGFKFTTVIKILKELEDSGNYFWHQYILDTDSKIKGMKNIMSTWCITDYKDSNIQGWMSPSELSWLYLYAKEMKSIVEIGSWKGKSAHALASGCSGKIYLIENFSGNPKEHPEVEQDLATNMSQFKNVQILKESSIEAAKRFEDRSIDMIFIDGRHERRLVYEDIEAWYPKCKYLLCGHDYDRDDVKLGIADTSFVPTLEVGSIWSIKNFRTKYAD